MGKEMYRVEDILNDDKLYYRIHAMYVRDGDLIPGAFCERGDGMSTDWEKYSTPEQSRQRANSNPQQNGIVSFIVGPLRNELNLEVIHKPSDDNRAHSLVKGKEVKIQHNTEARLKLLSLLQWEIFIPQDN
ncbi:MAG: hypothetical protein KJ077_10415 [Anaerolineae bacterium]|nr:hypothetical protein [Anaerolineae bacterium]